jgi:farnesyl diphosphate synthase
LITPPKEFINGDEFDFSNYNDSQYNSIVKWKTAYYSFCLPIESALLLAEIDDAEVHQKCREILIEMGTFFQIQVTFLDLKWIII